MKIISVFDIETGPLGKDWLDNIKPEFVANKTLKDPEKIKADLEAKERDWYERAALDATTGKVICIGMASGLASADVCGQGVAEEAIIERFWNWLELRLARSEQCVGFAIKYFDLPFLVRRSWALNVEVPRIIMRGRYWHDDIIDLQDLWRCGNYEQKVSLDILAKTLALGEKTGDGADFQKLWDTDRKAAIEYVLHDLKLTRLCAERMLGIKQVEEMPHLKPTETKLFDAPK